MLAEEFEIEENHEVSMNMFGLQKDIIDFIKDDIGIFFKSDDNDFATCEYLLPNIVTDYKNKMNKEVKVLPTTSMWYGVTYKEDKDSVVNAINKMIEEGIYPKNLWK